MKARAVATIFGAGVASVSSRALCGSGLAPTPTLAPTPEPTSILSALTIGSLNVTIVDSNNKRVEVAAERTTCYAVDLCSAEVYDWSFHSGELSWSNSLTGDFLRLYTNWNCMGGQVDGFPGAALAPSSGRTILPSDVAFGAFMILPSSTMSDETDERANACLFPDLFEASGGVMPSRVGH